MKNSIRKIASLCLAMMMVLSIMAVPAFATETEDHIHNYDVSTSFEYAYLDSETHSVTEIHCHKCKYCDNMFYETHEKSPASHVAGASAGSYQFTDPITGATVTYYRYRCKICKGIFAVED